MPEQTSPVSASTNPTETAKPPDEITIALTSPITSSIRLEPEHSNAETINKDLTDPLSLDAAASRSPPRSIDDLLDRLPDPPGANEISELTSNASRSSSVSSQIRQFRQYYSNSDDSESPSINSGYFPETMADGQVVESGVAPQMDFIQATQHGYVDRCIELLDSGEVEASQTDEEGICPLHWAAINNRVDLIQVFLQRGAFIDQIGGELAGTPLHWAVRQGCFLASKTLLEKGANVTLMDGEGLTVFHISAQTGNWTLLALMIAATKGQHVDIRDNIGRTPMMHALMRCQLETCRVLCTLGAKLNSQDAKMNSCLHWAVISNFPGGINQILGYTLRHSRTKRVGSTNAPSLLPSPIGLRRVADLLMISNEQKQTALEYARISKNMGCRMSIETFVKMLPNEPRPNKSIDVESVPLVPHNNSSQSDSTDFMATGDNHRHNLRSAFLSGINAPSNNNQGPISDNKIVQVFDKLCIKAFSRCTFQTRSILSFLFPTLCYFALAFLCASSYVAPFPWKLFMAIPIYLVIYQLSRHLVIRGAERFIPIGISCGIKIFGMLTAVFTLTKYMSWAMNLIWFIICPLTWYCLYKAVRSNPGFLVSFDEKMDKDAAYDELRRDLHMYCEDPSVSRHQIRICTTCMVRKPLRSKHCTENQIDKCCGRFDHYCPWIINVVGYKNHHWFLYYLLMVLTIIAWHFYAALVYTDIQCNLKVTLKEQGGPFSVAQCEPWMVLLMGEMVIFFIWVFLLLTTQLWMNIVEGATTNESINYKRSHGHSHGGAPSTAADGQRYKPLKIPMINRFTDLFQLRRRNVDWRRMYTQDDLIKEGMLPFNPNTDQVV